MRFIKPELNDEEHKTYHRRIVYISLLIMIILFGGASIYSRIEGWRFIDALYFSAATMTTVGYGDITPHTDAGKLFTVFFVFTSVGLVLYGLTVIAAHFVEIREEFWLQKLGKIRIKHHTGTYWEKIKNFFRFSERKLVKDYTYTRKNR